MMQPAAFGITVSSSGRRASSLTTQPPGEFDPFMDVFDWDDFTSFDLGT